MDYRYFNNIYPRRGRADFDERANRNWEYLKKGRNCAAHLLYLNLRTKHSKLEEEQEKFNIFLIWLILCLKRPWENNWKCPISDEFLKNEIGDILDETLKTYPDLPDSKTLRSHIKKEYFKLIVAWIPARPKLRKMIMALRKAFGFNELQLLQKIRWPKKPDFEPLKLLVPLSEQRYISRRDLMRKFGINKEHFDDLLARLIRVPLAEDYIKIKKFPNNSVWIIYTGPFFR